ERAVEAVGGPGGARAHAPHEVDVARARGGGGVGEHARLVERVGIGPAGAVVGIVLGRVEVEVVVHAGHGVDEAEPLGGGQRRAVVALDDAALGDGRAVDDDGGVEERAIVAGERGGDGVEGG